MIHIAGTMPEAKYRSTKKRVQLARPIRNSEFANEIKAVQPTKVDGKVAARKSRFSYAATWPLGVGLFLAGFAPEWHAMATEAGIWALRVTFPLSVLATRPNLGIDAQVALYAQTPLDGLLAMFLLASGKSLKATVALLLSMHGVCAIALWLLAMYGN